MVFMFLCGLLVLVKWTKSEVKIRCGMSFCMILQCVMAKLFVTVTTSSAETLTF